MLLNGKLALHDIDDTEALCVFVIKRSGLELSRQDREELLTQLIEDCWKLSLRFEHDGISFSTWATTTLKRRVVDWQRQSGGRTKWQFANRTYERTLPSLVALDDREDGADHRLTVDADTHRLRDVLGLQ